MRQMLAQLHSCKIEEDSTGVTYLSIYLSFSDVPFSSLYHWALFEDSPLRLKERFSEIEVVGSRYQITPSEHIFVGRLA